MRNIEHNLRALIGPQSLKDFKCVQKFLGVYGCQRMTSVNVDENKMFIFFLFLEF